MNIKLWLLLLVVLSALASIVIVRARRRSLIGRYNAGKATWAEQQYIEMYIETGLLTKNGYLVDCDGKHLPQVRVSDDWLARLGR